MALFDVLACGPQNKFLTDEPVVSFFQNSYAQHTPFARESVELTVSGQVGFGSQMVVPLNRRGDMVGKVYIVLRLPGIRHKAEDIQRPSRSYFVYEDDDSSFDHQRRGGDHHRHHHGESRRGCNSSSSGSSCSSSSSTSSCTSSSSKNSDCSGNADDISSYLGARRNRKFVYWNNAIGHLILDWVSFQIGNNDVCKHYGEFLEVFDELTTKPGKSTDEMIGRHRKERTLWEASRKAQTLYVPMRFFFCEHIGKALPILAIHHSNIRLLIKTRDLGDCYYSSDGSIPCLIDSHQELSPRDLKVQVYANVYYLSEWERDDLNEDEHEQLILQVQYNGGQLVSCQNSATNAPIVCKLPFQHPVVEVIFAIQDEHHLTRKDWFNYSGLNNEDPLVSCKMSVNNHERFAEREGKWFRLIEPHEHHTNIPRRHIYSYSFAVFPEDIGQPSGSLNFSRVDDVLLHIVLQRGLGTSLFKCWCMSWNVMRCLFGLAGLAYTGC